MRISIRSLVKELLEKDYLIVDYIELQDGGFDLSVRINEEELNKGILDEPAKTNGITKENVENLCISTPTNSCEGCPIYEYIKTGKSVVNDACSFCSKSPIKVGDQK